jgi:hypothetical protein
MGVKLEVGYLLIMGKFSEVIMEIVNFILLELCKSEKTRWKCPGIAPLDVFSF